MIPVVGHLETSPDDGSDPRRGPQITPIAVGLGTAQQLAQQLLLLPRCELGRTAGRALDAQRRLSAARPGVAPAQDRTGGTADPGGDLAQVVARIQKLQRAAPAIFQNGSGTLGMHDGSFREEPIIREAESESSGNCIIYAAASKTRGPLTSDWIVSHCS